jgi:hypothetical protein
MVTSDAILIVYSVSRAAWQVRLWENSIGQLRIFAKRPVVVGVRLPPGQTSNIDIIQVKIQVGNIVNAVYRLDSRSSQPSNRTRTA